MFILTAELTAAEESLLQCDKYNDAVLHFGDYADVDTDGMLPETTFHLRRKSPFAVFFRWAIETDSDTADRSADTGIAVANELYSPACSKPPLSRVSSAIPGTAKRRRFLLQR